MGVDSPVSEILLPSKTAKFPFQPIDYSPWSSKNLIDWNQLKKFMQVGIDEICMYTNFGGCDLSGFGDTATFKDRQISLSDHGLYYIFLFMLYIFFMWLYLFYFICRCLLQERYSNLFIFMQTRYSVHFTIILLCSQNSHCVYIIYIIAFVIDLIHIFQ